MKLIQLDNIPYIEGIQIRGGKPLRIVMEIEDLFVVLAAAIEFSRFACHDQPSTRSQEYHVRTASPVLCPDCCWNTPLVRVRTEFGF